MYVDNPNGNGVAGHTPEAKVLIRRARDLIENRGWIRSAYQLPEGYCIIGAILEVADVPFNYPNLLLDDEDIAVAIAIDLIGEAIGLEASDDEPMQRSIEIWNDDPYRSKTEVLRVLNEAGA